MRLICLAEGTGGGGFLPVEVAPMAAPTRLVVVTGAGHRVAGLDMDGVVALLARLP